MARHLPLQCSSSSNDATAAAHKLLVLSSSNYSTPMAGAESGAGEAETHGGGLPRPRSPPGYPDLCGRHRLQAQVQTLSREIGFLEEEIQSVEGLHPASVCCKEVDEYVTGATPDPLIPIYKNRHRPCCISRWIRGLTVFNATPTCFCCGDCLSQKKRQTCACRPDDRPSCCGCPRRRCCCCCRRGRRVSCSKLGSAIPSLSCLGYSCGCVCSCSNSTGLHLCPRCVCCIGHCVCE